MNPGVLKKWVIRRDYKFGVLEVGGTVSAVVAGLVVNGVKGVVLGLFNNNFFILTH